MRLSITPETQFLIKATEQLYKKTLLEQVSFSDIDCNKFIQIALKNNILLYCADILARSDLLGKSDKAGFAEIVSKGKEELGQISKSIDAVEKFVPEYIIFKTYRGQDFQRIGNDVDVLIKEGELERIKNIFKNEGYALDNDDAKEKSVGLLFPGQKKIHLQGAITWCWTSFLDEDLLYGKTREVIYNGRKIRIPGYDADFLIFLAHMNFEPLCFTYSELLYLFTLIPEVDSRVFIEQTKKYRWHGTALRTLGLMNGMHEALYGHPIAIKLKLPKIQVSTLDFPYTFSRKHLVEMCIEKRLFVYPLSRLMKVAEFFFTKNASRYLDSPERHTLKNASK